PPRGGPPRCSLGRSRSDPPETAHRHTGPAVGRPMQATEDGVRGTDSVRAGTARLSRRARGPRTGPGERRPRPTRRRPCDQVDVLIDELQRLPRQANGSPPGPRQLFSPRGAPRKREGLRALESLVPEPLHDDVAVPNAVARVLQELQPTHEL